MKEKFTQFMQGRYGIDQFGQFLNIVIFVFLLLSLFGVPLAMIFALGLLIYAYMRIFSRQREKRLAENRMYLQEKAKITRWFTTRKQRFSQRNNYKYFRCPHCKQELRVPKGKGTVNVKCPKCHNEFEKTS